MHPVRERGFVLLALLFVGVLGGGGWLAVQGGGAAPAQALRAVADLARARRAVEALSAHATLYPDLYGPTGAGPGHLPCPDRHQPPDGRLDPVALPRAGPDPPCAAYPAPAGALPLHVNVVRLRAGIDPAPGGAAVLGYRVDAAVINNPLDRLVNARTMPAVPARVHLRGTGRPLALRRGTLAPGVQRRIAAWLVARLGERVAVPGCEGVSPCPALVALGALTGTGAVMDDGALLEGVPLARHWFVRNGWQDDVRLRIAVACRHDMAACGARIDPDRPLHIDWQPSPVMPEAR